MTNVAREKKLQMMAVAGALSRSESSVDRRKGNDLGQVVELTDGVWSDRLSLLDVGPGPRRTLVVSVRLDVTGLIWQGDAQPHRGFDVALAIPNNYPLAAPLVVVNNPTPFSMNVLHGDFVPNPQGLPGELQQILRDGHDGFCCYSLASEWCADLDHNLALVLWQVSRILVGAKIHGEQYALNRQARDRYLQLRQDGLLPLGPALPTPVSLAAVAAGGPMDEAIEWIEED